MEHDSLNTPLPNLVPEIRFPREADVIYRAALAYRSLSPTDRLLALLDLIGVGKAIMENSAAREAARALRLADEERWRQVQRELFAQYAARTAGREL